MCAVFVWSTAALYSANKTACTVRLHEIHYYLLYYIILLLLINLIGVISNISRIMWSKIKSNWQKAAEEQNMCRLFDFGLHALYEIGVNRSVSLRWGFNAVATG